MKICCFRPRRCVFVAYWVAKFWMVLESLEGLAGCREETREIYSYLTVPTTFGLMSSFSLRYHCTKICTRVQLQSILNAGDCHIWKVSSHYRRDISSLSHCR